MATILPFLKYDSVFTPEVTHAMSVAFDEVCTALELSEANKREREVVATRIIELARRGEINAENLRERVLSEASGNADRAQAIRKWRGAR